MMPQPRKDAPVAVKADCGPPLRTGLEIAIARKVYPGKGQSAPVTALADLAFSVPAGQWLSIVGPSGSGKTTLLNLIAALDTDMDGVIKLAGAVSGASGAPGAVGYMFQSPRLMPWLSALDNVRLALPESADPKPAIDLLNEMELGEFLHAFPKQLSGGMQRRVALARSFAGKPTILLLDEPFLSLDAPSAERLRQLTVRAWQRHPATVLFVTHDLDEAIALGDRVLFFSERPARVVLDRKIDLPRPRRGGSGDIQAFRRALLREHPEILSGLAVETGKGEGFLP
jgi:NitT/TauT family transport system ATP-binding protein